MWFQFLNIFFFVFHSVFTLFNITGWAFRKTRKWHLITMLLTAASWFILGIWYGWGYCVFGKVTQGMDIVDKIKAVATTNRAGHQNVPVENVVIESVTVE